MADTPRATAVRLDSRRCRPAGRGLMLIALMGLIVAGTAIGARSRQVGATADPHAAAALEKFLSRPGAAQEYRAFRRLEAAGGGQRGWLEAQTEFTAASGMRYDVTAEGGSGYIRSRVLRSLLEQEREVIASGATHRIAMDASNYAFIPDGIGADGLASVTLQPLRKDRALIAGTIFLTPGEGHIVRVEGRLAKNPSFWTRRVDVVRVYARLNGIQVPVSLQSIAQLRLFGRSSLQMTYQYSHVGGRPVEGGESAAAVANGTRNAYSF